MYDLQRELARKTPRNPASLPTRIYLYIVKDAVWDKTTNIFTDIFIDSIRRINPDKPDIDPKRELDAISLALDGDDLGKVFYAMLTTTAGTKLIDFENLAINSWHVVTELPCVNGEDEFRPDITLLINGMPLAFIEVKKPNNREGIIAERDRINTISDTIASSSINSLASFAWTDLRSKSFRR